MLPSDADSVLNNLTTKTPLSMFAISHNVFNQCEGTSQPRKIGTNNEHASTDRDAAVLANENSRAVMLKHPGQRVR
jgi:hypothetical protein